MAALPGLYEHYTNSFIGLIGSNAKVFRTYKPTVTSVKYCPYAVFFLSWSVWVGLEMCFCPCVTNLKILQKKKGSAINWRHSSAVCLCRIDPSGICFPKDLNLSREEPLQPHENILWSFHALETLLGSIVPR